MRTFFLKFTKSVHQRNLWWTFGGHFGLVDTYKNIKSPALDETFVFKNEQFHYIFIITYKCLSTFNTTPIALIKTSKKVEPEEMNGRGKPVGGIEPVNISYCTMNLSNKKRVFTTLFLYFEFFLAYVTLLCILV